jgi:hypothetical protein
MANRVRPIEVSAADRAQLERLQRAPSTPAGLSRRARAVLLMSQGVSGVEIAKRIGYTVVQVSRMPALRRGRRGWTARTPHVGPAPDHHQPQACAYRCHHAEAAPGAGLTHWTTRDLARSTGVSHATVHRIWQANALQPHRVTTSKFTTDPDAEAKIHDVVGLYLNPPPSCSAREDADPSAESHATALAAALGAACHTFVKTVFGRIGANPTVPGSFAPAF